MATRNNSQDISKSEDGECFLKEWDHKIRYET